MSELNLCAGIAVFGALQCFGVRFRVGDPPAVPRDRLLKTLASCTQICAANSGPR
jgi:hypothetical protein